MSKPQMKVLWIFSTFGLDAPARRFASIATRLGGEYEHLIGSMSGDFEAETLIPDGVNWRRIDLPRSKRSGVSVANMWSARRLLSAERPNLLITSNWDSIEWLMVNRGPGSVPHVHFEDPFGREERLDVDDAKRAWSRRRALPGRNRTFVASTGELEQAFSEIWAAPKSQVRLVPHGVDLDLFSPRQHDNSRRPIVIGAAGPLIAQRRFDRVIRMTATLVERGRDVRCVILGDGPEKARLIGEAETAGVKNRVQFTPAVSGCARVFAEIDLYAAAGDSQRDASGLLAAMASGVPIVGLDTNDIRDTVDSSNRLFVRPSDDESGMIAAAELLVSDAELRDRLGRANRVKAEHEFDIGAIAKRYDMLFREAAGVSSFLALPAPKAAESKPIENKPASKSTENDATAQSRGTKESAQAPSRVEPKAESTLKGSTGVADASVPLPAPAPKNVMRPKEATTPKTYPVARIEALEDDTSAPLGRSIDAKQPTASATPLPAPSSPARS